MTLRYSSVCLAAAMVVALAAESRAQSSRGQRKADGAATAQEKSPAAGEEPAAPASSSLGSTDEPNTKDPFDQAAGKVKGAATKGGSLADSSEPKLEKATFGAGCFWHVEAEFEWLPGVKSAVSGYSGGHVPNPSYEMVHEGDTDPAEVVQVEYDP
jgi:peptide-methionine (S)-S-oxide reductase